MKKCKVVNIDGIELEISYEEKDSQIEMIYDAKLNSIDKDIYDILSSNVRDDIDEQLQIAEDNELLNEEEGVA